MSAEEKGAPMRAEDGSHLTATANASPVRRCERCGEELGVEQWWVTRYPAGVHTRCRDWEAAGFPFARHLTLLQRLRFQTQGDAQQLVVQAEAWFRRFDRAWPRPGAEGVLQGSRLLSRLRSRLAAAGVDPKLINQL